MEKKRFGKRGAAVTGVAAVAVLALLFGTGKLGFGTGDSLGEAPASGKEDQAIVSTVDAAESTEKQAEAPALEERIEIRVQGREYNYQNLSYGAGEHPLEELLEALDPFPRETRIELSVEADATKNAVDELEKALAEAGFTNVHK